MTVFFQDHDDHYCFRIEDQRNKLDHLPSGIYRLKIEANPVGVSVRLFKDIKAFVLPERRFGRHESIVKKVINEYDSVNPPLGLMAIGYKGSGKSILCEDICNRLLQKGLPVLLVSDPVPADFLQLMAKAIGPCVFYFDEIGKVYSSSVEQDPRNSSNTSLNQLLPFFSNQSLIGTVFLVTANESRELNEYFINRPGRFKYRIDMKRLDRATYLDYMKAQSITPNRMLWLETIWHSLSFDQLKAIVPLMKTCSTIEEFMLEVDILNVTYISTKKLNIRNVFKNGNPIVPRSTNSVFTAKIEGKDVVIQIDEVVLRVPWVTSEGTIPSYFSSGYDDDLYTDETGEYTVNGSFVTIVMDQCQNLIEGSRILRFVSFEFGVPADASNQPVTQAGTEVKKSWNDRDFFRRWRSGEFIQPAFSSSTGMVDVSIDFSNRILR